MDAARWSNPFVLRGKTVEDEDRIAEGETIAEVESRPTFSTSSSASAHGPRPTLRLKLGTLTQSRRSWRTRALSGAGAWSTTSRSGPSATGDGVAGRRLGARKALCSFVSDYRPVTGVWLAEVSRCVGLSVFLAYGAGALIHWLRFLEAPLVHEEQR